MDSSKGVSDQNERAEQKQLSLDQLKRESTFFSALPIKRFKIIAIWQPPQWSCFESRLMYPLKSANCLKENKFFGIITCFLAFLLSCFLAFLLVGCFH